VRVARAIGVIGMACWLGFGCAAGRDYTPESYVVRPQDTLYSIAWRHDLDYHDLARWNDIGADYRIAVGQVLTLKPAGAMPPPASGKQPPRPAPAAIPQAPVAANPGVPLRWIWPTEHASAPRPVPGGGILLLGQLGQPIRAACGGRVVYAGNGIRGYGDLIIIKHEDNLLSAYAHTRELTVREGETVKGGEIIAQMGEGPHEIAALYFEIRRNGKPIDPLPFLPNVK
jgi:lipoprotein NlpD